MQKMRSGFPNLILFTKVHPARWISRVRIPDGFDFDKKDDSLGIYGNDIQLAVLITVIPSEKGAPFSEIARSLDSFTM